MKCLVVYYSRTGTTKEAAEQIAKKLGADIEQITEEGRRNGALGYFRSGHEAMKKDLPDINPLKSNLSTYDLVVIGSPVWAWNMSSPIRTFVSESKSSLPDVAFFCTQGKSGAETAFSDMKEIIEKEPISTLALLTTEVKSGEAAVKVEDFVSKLK